MSEYKSTLKEERSRLNHLLDRCRDSQGYGGFSLMDRQALVSCIERIIELKIQVVSDPSIEAEQYTPCRGCGADRPKDRCIGCFHQF